MTNARPNPLMILAALALCLGGCQGIVWANLAAVFLTVALFLGTVQLRRSPKPAVGSGSATTSIQPSSQQQA